MTDFTKTLNPYERKARLYPALLCLFPIIISISISYPETYSSLSGFVALGATIGILQLISNLARDRGKNLESKLFEQWGGMPSLSILRYRDNSIPTPAKEKYHAILASKSKIGAPTILFEQKYPEKADEIYASWSDFLRGKTRDINKYPLVFQENINYGFRRNLLGIKWYCILSSIISILILFIPSIETLILSDIQIVVFLLLILYLWIFAFVVKSNWVKTVANAYSKNLIEAINI